MSSFKIEHRLHKLCVVAFGNWLTILEMLDTCMITMSVELCDLCQPKLCVKIEVPSASNNNVAS